MEQVVGFFQQPLHWAVLFLQPQFSSSSVFPRCCFSDQAWAAALGYGGRSREVGDRRSTGAQGSPQRHHGELTLHGQPQVRTATAQLPSGPRNTATLLGLTCSLTREDKEATSIMAKREGNVKKTSPILRLPYMARAPVRILHVAGMHEEQHEAKTGRYLPSQGPPRACPSRCTSGRCFPCRLATVNAQRVSSFPSLLPLL